MLRLLHITDTHLVEAPRGLVSGWRTQASLDAVLEDALVRCGPIDAVLASGDLVHDGSLAGYRRLGRRLARLGVPVCALPGNHDDPEAMARGMAPQGNINVLARTVLGRWQILPLNSHVPGRDEGRLGEAQLQRLGTLLARHRQPTLVAVHHPPIDVGSAWLDAMRLRDGESLLALCARHPHVHAIVFGHVHQVFEARHAHYRLYATPATCRQFQPFSEHFAEDDQPPGYRCFLLDETGVDSRLHRVASARTQTASEAHG